MRGAQQGTAQRVRHVGRDFVLYGEDVFQRTGVVLRPDVEAVVGANQLRGDAHAVVGLLHTAFEHIRHAQGRYRLWQSQLRGDEYRALEHIFKFVDYSLYTGRDDDFYIEVVMNEHQGQCMNRNGLSVRILSRESAGEFPLIGRVCDGSPEGELEEYRWDGSHYCDRLSDLVMPED